MFLTNKIDYIYKYIENIHLLVDKIYKVSIILLEIRRETLTLLRNC
jgi:hypothetical protein